VTAEGAVRRGLDFIAVTDHNTISEDDSRRELRPYFDRMLLIPGREITTFHGHANLFGATEFVDFLIGRNAVPDMTTMLRMAQEAGGVISINHPNAPSGEIWTEPLF
jgi:predicted metal-dependent phosphoesterase TrpH